MSVDADRLELLERIADRPVTSAASPRTAACSSAASPTAARSFGRPTAGVGSAAAAPLAIDGGRRLRGAARSPSDCRETDGNVFVKNTELSVVALGDG
jgi:hypothetical protein